MRRPALQRPAIAPMVLLASLLALMAVAGAASATTFASAAGAATKPPRTAHGARAAKDGPYYVAVGASESVGFQPVPGDRHGEPTDQGYADDLTAMEQSRWPGLQLVHFGCPGITAQGAMTGTGPCHFPAGSEVATAVQFIRAHPHEIALVTVDLGFNDIWPCLVHHTVDETCVDDALRRVGSALPAILSVLRAAGGSSLLVAGLQHADPYVADAHFGAVDFARSTLDVFARLNDVLSDAYRTARAVVVHVPQPGNGSVGGAAVESACTMTWMCAEHNIHPTAAGYRMIADAIAGAVDLVEPVAPAGG